MVYGKKRFKGKITGYVPELEGPSGTVSEYLEFGQILGLSFEESLKIVKQKLDAQEIVLDAKAEQTIEKLHCFEALLLNSILDLRKGKKPRHACRLR